MGKDKRRNADGGVARSVWLALATVTGAGLTPALAQTPPSPSETPPADTAARPGAETVSVFPPAQGLTPPPGAEDLRFTLRELVIAGQYTELEQEGERIKGIHELQDGNIGGWISVADIYRFASQLQQAYLDAGYPLARVIVPTQGLGDDGVVRLQVVDGFVESLDLEGLPEAARKRVRTVLSSLIGMQRPHRDLIERRLLLAGDTAGLTLRTTLTPGRGLGATVLVLEGEHKGIAGVIAADNRVSEAYGRWQATASVAFNSPFGFGEQIYATLAGLPESDMLSDEATRRYLAMGVNVPIGGDGLMATISGDYSTTRPEGDLTPLRLSSEYARAGVSLAYPLVRTRTKNIVMRAGFDAVSETQDTSITGTPVPLSADRLRVVRFGLEASGAIGDGGYGALRGELSRGIDGLGARTADDASFLKPLSRQGADADFSSFEASASLSAPVFSGVTFSAEARVQTSFGDPLLRSEQFSPIAANGISGPPPSAMIGDYGGVLRLELQAPLGSDAGFAAPYLFGATASVQLEQPTALELSRTDVTAIGAGVRFGGQPTASTALAVTLEVSEAQSDDPSLDRTWLSAGVSYRF